MNKLRLYNCNIGKVIVVFALALGGCNDIIDDTRDFNAEATITDEGDITPASLNLNVLTIYGRYREESQLNDLVAPAWGGDDLTATPSKPQFKEFDSRNVRPTNSRLTTSWNNMSRLLGRLNDQLSIINKFQEENTFESVVQQLDLAEINELKAELIVLRANIFHYFVRVYGKAPLQIDIDEEVTVLSSAVKVFSQIESDLLNEETGAVNFLQDVNSKTIGRPGSSRVSKGSAHALMARIYMDWAGWYGKGGASIYEKAAEQAKIVIDNSSASGFELLPVFEDLWKLENRFNNEMVFGLVFDASLDRNSPRGDNRKYGRVGYPSTGTVLKVNDDCSFVPDDRGRPTILESAPFSGWDETFAEIRFYEDFPEQPRKDGTFRRDLDCFWPTQTTKTVRAPLYTKIAGPEGDLSDTAFSTSRSDFWIRYADVLLMYAEASGRAGDGNNPEAWEALNQVNRRAWGLFPLSPSAERDYTIADGNLEDLTFAERKWEFAGEWLRWFDLVRMDRVQEALGGDARTPRVSTDIRGRLLRVNVPIEGVLTSANYLAPIPTEILDINPGFAN